MHSPIPRVSWCPWGILVSGVSGGCWCLGSGGVSCYPYPSNPCILVPIRRAPMTIDALVAGDGIGMNTRGSAKGFWFFLNRTTADKIAWHFPFDQIRHRIWPDCPIHLALRPHSAQWPHRRARSPEDTAECHPMVQLHGRQA